jgi:RNA polymerase sigma-70 factor (ECF subfamily)
MTSQESCRMTFIPAITPSLEVDVAGLAVTHSATLYKVAYAVLRDPDQSKDVVQDVFLRVLKHHSRLPEICDLRVWLVRIAWNLALDSKKQKKGDQMDTLFAEQLVANQPSAHQIVEQHQRYQAVLKAIDRLPKLEKQALLLATVNEIGTAEISQIMNRTESAIRGLVHRARARLHNDLEGGL